MTPGRFALAGDAGRGEFHRHCRMCASRVALAAPAGPYCGQVREAPDWSYGENARAAIEAPAHSHPDSNR